MSQEPYPIAGQAENATAETAAGSLFDHPSCARRLTVVLALSVVAVVFGLSSPDAIAQDTYDLVLKGDTVIDPETGLQAQRNLAIRTGHIAAITESE